MGLQGAGFLKKAGPGRESSGIFPPPPTWDVVGMPRSLLHLAARVDHDAVGLAIALGGHNRAGPELAQPMLVPLQLPVVTSAGEGVAFQRLLGYPGSAQG
ncbi:hypothetical protein ACKKBF_B40250 [Auxenochlorella protothecoides x Auxenochlorella symbiontica]